MPNDLYACTISESATITKRTASVSKPSGEELKLHTEMICCEWKLYQNIRPSQKTQTNIAKVNSPRNLDVLFTSDASGSDLVARSQNDEFVLQFWSVLL
jgi:hypothetical protein